MEITSPDKLSASPVRRKLPWDQSGRLNEILTSHKRGFRAGSTIKLDGEDSDSTFLVLSGWLAASKTTPDGDRQIIEFVLPGEIINPTSADDTTSAVQIEALTYATLAVVPMNKWKRLLREHDELREFDQRFVAGLLARLSERVLRLGKGTAETRVAYALIELCIRLDVIGEVDNASFNIPLTQMQLGDFVGLSSVHVCRTMRRMVRQGTIQMGDHMDIVILDMAALSEMAEIDPHALAREIIPAA